MALTQEEASEAEAQVMSLQEHPTPLLLEILVRAGAWTDVEGGPMGLGWNDRELAGERANIPIHSALSVCRQFRGLLVGSPQHMAALLLTTERGNSETALVCACTMGHEGAARALLELKDPPHADCNGSEALILATRFGHQDVVRLLLGWGQDAPRANDRDSFPLIMAASYGQEAVARLLLQYPEHPARADCMEGVALLSAAQYGNEAIARLLLEDPNHPAPTAWRVVHCWQQHNTAMHPSCACFWRIQTTPRASTAWKVVYCWQQHTTAIHPSCACFGRPRATPRAPTPASGRC